MSSGRGTTNEGTTCRERGSGPLTRGRGTGRKASGTGIGKTVSEVKEERESLNEGRRGSGGVKGSDAATAGEDVPSARRSGSLNEGTTSGVEFCALSSSVEVIVEKGEGGARGGKGEAVSSQKKESSRCNPVIDDKPTTDITEDSDADNNTIQRKNNLNSSDSSDSETSKGLCI